jgi:hypothetical protein
MHELDRVFKRHHVNLRARVQFIEHGRECGGLARSGGAGDEDDAGLFANDFLAHGRQFQPIARRYLRAELAHHDPEVPVLAENIYAEARHIRHGVTCIAGAVAFEIALEAFVVSNQLRGNTLCMRRL